jgi:hypothetical protein
VAAVRRSVGVLALVLGAALVVSTIAIDGFGLTRSGDRLIDGARPTMRDDVAQLRHDFDTLDAAGRQSVEEAFPAIARTLGMTTEQFLAVIDRGYPAIATALDRRDELTNALRATVTNLEAHTDDFAAADDLPAPGFALRSMPWALLAVGGALGAAGALVVWRRSTAAVWVVAALGLLLVVPTLLFQVPQNSADAEDLVDSLNITTETATRTREQFEVQRAAVDEQATRFFPDLAAELGVSTEQFVSALSADFPAVGRGIAEADAILGRIEGEVRFRERSVDEFADVDDVPMGVLPWFLVAGGLVLVLVAGAEIVRVRQSARHLAVPDAGAAPATG